MVTAAQHEIARLLHRDGAVCRREHPQLVSALDWLVATGRLHPVLPGVFVAAERADDPRTRALALGRGVPGAVLTGSVAASWSFWPGITVDRVSAAVTGKRTSVPGFVFERRRVPAALVREHGGVLLTSPALTALDLVGTRGGDAIDQVLRTRAATLGELAEALAATAGRRGNRERLRMLLDSRDEPWSAAERLLHRILRAGGLRGWRTNVAVLLPSGRCYLDVAFDRERLAVEADGWEFHARRPADFDATLRRHCLLEAAGWRVLHVTWAHLVEDPAWVLEVVHAALRECAREIDHSMPARLPAQPGPPALTTTTGRNPWRH